MSRGYSRGYMLGDGYTTGVGMSRGYSGCGYVRGRWSRYVQGVGIPEGVGRGGYVYPPPDMGPGIPIPPPCGGHHNTYSWQVGGTHSTGMLSCIQIQRWLSSLIDQYQWEKFCSSKYKIITKNRV